MDRPGALTPQDAQRRLIGAVRSFTAQRRADDPGFADGGVCVGLSGGADSLALTAAAVHAGLAVHALVVDHRLQAGSAQAAREAVAQAVGLGAQASILPVTVHASGEGPEAAARTARYQALDRAREGRPVLLGHTVDDQAETVLLGLGRGSGARSLAGMSPWRAPWARPLLGVRRADTRAACAGWGLTVWDDPHNLDPRYTRVRVRTEVLPLLEEVLGGGVAAALARTAGLLQHDAHALDELAESLLERARDGDGLRVTALQEAPTALRTRALRAWIAERGGDGAGARTVEQVDALITHWHGQGPVAIGGDSEARLVVTRRSSVVTVCREPRGTPRG
ncbi:tRNA lysidine(34) synthetase TilS [Gordonia sp. VNK21]|uniref:tRNA lysidine(34) synthetase TilS n=1 Tax=Gordonia sp. VNK21 TaxID=3382483 RepID=UPI0038D4915A